jgi:hypothetical protein
MPLALATLCCLGMNNRIYSVPSRNSHGDTQTAHHLCSYRLSRPVSIFLQTQQTARALAWDAKQLVAVDLGVIQQRSILPKTNDVCGIELLRAAIQNITMWAHFSVVFPSVPTWNNIQGARWQPASLVADEQDESIRYIPYFFVVHCGDQSRLHHLSVRRGNLILVSDSWIDLHGLVLTTCCTPILS